MVIDVSWQRRAPIHMQGQISTPLLALSAKFAGIPSELVSRTGDTKSAKTGRRFGRLLISLWRGSGSWTVELWFTFLILNNCVHRRPEWRPKWIVSGILHNTVLKRWSPFAWSHRFHTLKLLVDQKPLSWLFLGYYSDSLSLWLIQRSRISFLVKVVLHIRERQTLFSLTFLSSSHVGQSSRRDLEDVKNTANFCWIKLKPYHESKVRWPLTSYQLHWSSIQLSKSWPR